jgi:uncharacterized surface protein with fasciclin (FAS1) repeats
MLMTRKKLRGTLVSTIAIVLAAGSLFSGVNAAPENKQSDIMKKPDATSAPDVMATPDTMKKPADAMKKPIATPSTKPATTPSTKKGTTVVGLVNNSTKNFKTLNAAVKASGLAATLSGEGPFTLFAPNDAAFEKLPKATLKNLLKPENKAALQQVLKNHVLSGTVLSKDIKAGNVTTLAGSEVAVKINGKKVTVGKASVLRADVQASNGVVHIIDTVLVPTDLKLK